MSRIPSVRRSEKGVYLHDTRDSHVMTGGFCARRRPGIFSIYSHLSGTHGLARRLLYIWLMFGLASTSACIIPVPLDKEPARVNDVPRIINDSSSPAFGRIRHAPADSFDFTIVADDQNINDDPPDTLTARLLRSATTGTGLVLALEITLLPTNDPDHPARTSGSFGARQYCQVFAGSTDLTVVVSDRPFNASPAPPESTAGDKDYRNWILECQ